MDTLQLRQILSFDPFTKPVVRMVCAKDELPSTVTTVSHTQPTAYVVNLDPSHLPGSHWVALYFDRHVQGEYFDSMGLPPIPECEHLLSQCVQHMYSTHQLQDQTQVCGQFCVTFLLLRCRGYSFQDVIKQLDTPHNDRLVHSLIKPYFSNLPFSL